jgi:ACS family hexuronate transporter-like MFS transporter
MTENQARIVEQPVVPAASSHVEGRAGGRGGFFSGRFRWVICAVLFIGISKNYMDRQVLGVLKETLQHDLGWNEIDYGNLVFAFQAAYAVGMLAVGRFIDRAGTRIGYGLAMVFWSLASMAHALCGSLLTFGIARAALGLGESGAFPASIKTVTEWFPQKERALATGIFNAGTNVGAIVTPLIVPWITIHYGWRWAFLITGGIGFLWFLLWMNVYRKPEDHPRCSRAELEHIKSDQEKPTARVPWVRLLGYRQTWAFIIAKFLTDPIWWFYLFWVPGFLQREHGLNLMQVGLPLVLIYLISDAGSVAGGWLSSNFIHRGFSVNAGRKVAMLICAVCVVPIVYAYRAEGLWTTTLLIGLAAAAHQGFSANLFTTASDMFPSHAVASVVGIGGMAGAAGGMLIATIVGHVLQATGSYLIPFFIAGTAYLIALGVMHLIVPRLQPVNSV